MLAEWAGELNFLTAFLAVTGIYALMTLGLNLQWGMAGLLNIGIAGFYGIGAYSVAILTTHSADHWSFRTQILGFFGEMAGYAPLYATALLAAMVISGFLALVIGLITIRLRTDYLAIATIGIAEIIRIWCMNAQSVTGGAFGIKEIPQPLQAWQPLGNLHGLGFTLLVLAILTLCYLLAARAHASPWGRTLIAIRDREDAARAIGKPVMRYRLQAFVLGSMLMGLAGGLHAQYNMFFDATALDPLLTTFLVWVMLIVGGSGNHRGAVLGAALVWLIYKGTEQLIAQLPEQIVTQSGSLRLLLIGAILILMLHWRPQGFWPEYRPNQPPTVKTRSSPPPVAAEKDQPSPSAAC